MKAARLLRLNLRTKLLLLFLIVGLLPLALTGGSNIFLTTNLLRDNAVDEEQQLVQQQAAAIEQYLSAAQTDVLLLSQSVVMRNLANTIAENDTSDLSSAQTALSQEFENFVRQRTLNDAPVYQQLRLLDQAGIEIARADASEEASPDALGVHTTDDYFLQARNLPAGQIYISPIRLFNEADEEVEAGGEPVLHYSTPIYVEDIVVGVLVADVRAQGFLDLVQANASADRITFLVDQDGYYLSHTDPAKTFGRDVESGIRLQSDQPALTFLLTGTPNGSRTLENNLAVYTPVIEPGQAGNSWVIVSLRPLDTILADARQQQVVLILALVAAAAFVAVVGLVFARGLSRPIVDLTHISTQVASGDLTQKATISRQDEIGTLAETFNLMTDQLRQTVENLESRVTERTRTLQSILDMSVRISTILDIRQVIQDVADLTKERFGLYHAQIYLLDSAGQNLVLVAGAGYIGELMVAQQRSIELRNINSIVASAARSLRGLVINDVTRTAEFLPHPLLPDTRSEASIALVARGQLVGVLDAQSDKLDFFTTDMYTILEVIAKQVAAAISNSSLYEEAERSSRHERTLGTIARSIESATSLDEILQTTVRELGKALRVPYTAIELQLQQEDPVPPAET